MRSQPGIFESGSPPSVPFNFLKRATRFIIALRDMPRRGSVSLYSMIASYLMLHNNSWRRRHESTALCLRATSVARRSARAARVVQGRRAGARRRPEPRADDELPRRSAESSRRHQPHRRALRNQGREEPRPHRSAHASRRDRALGRDCAPSTAYRSGDAAYRASCDSQSRYFWRELRAGGSGCGAACLRARARRDLRRRRGISPAQARLRLGVRRARAPPWGLRHGRSRGARLAQRRKILRHARRLLRRRRPAAAHLGIREGSRRSVCGRRRPGQARRRSRTTRRPARFRRDETPSRQGARRPRARENGRRRRMNASLEAIEISLTVNGERVKRSVPARLNLADFLRNELELTGTHVGCEHGVCGACTVRVDGEIVRGCLMFAAQADGCKVDTVEGLSDSREIEALQRDEPDPSRERIREYLSGNYCRCTGYQAIVDAIEAVAKARAARAA